MKRNALRSLGSLFALWAFLLLGVAYGQGDRGTLAGTVTDSSRAAISGATVTVRSSSTDFTKVAQTDSSGEYRMPVIPMGTYTVTVEHPGFNKWESQDVVININTLVTLDAQMVVGATSETVVVTAAPPLLSEEGSNLGKVMTNQQISELPLSLGGGPRSTYAFIPLLPGVTTANGDRIAGGLLQGSSILMDGAESMSQRRNDEGMNGVSVEAIQEFKVQSSSYSAEFGRLSNGIVNFGLKSGTNNFHGSAFDFFRNEYFDANTNSWSPSRKGATRQDNPGVSFGGPILKDKLHFFTAYEYSYWVNPQPTNLVTIPTADIRNGDFRNYKDSNGRMIPIYDPFDASGNLITDQTQRQPMQCNGVYNMICPNRISSTIIGKLQSMLPAPQLATSNDRDNNYRAIAQTKNKQNVFSIKGDYAATAKDRLAFSFGRTFNPPYPELGPVAGVPTSNFGSDSLIRYYRFNEDHIFTNNLINHFTYGFDQRHIFEGGAGLTDISDATRDSVQYPGTDSRQGIQHGAITEYATEFTQWGSEVMTDSRQRSESLYDTLIWNRGNHTIKSGFNYYHWIYRRIDCISCNGTILFDGSATGNSAYDFSGTVPGSTDQFSTTNVGSNYAAFLLGLTSTAGFNWGADQAFSSPYFAWFVQDDWKASRKLSVNLGMRYEIPIPKVERHRNNSNFDPTLTNPNAGNTPGAIIFAGNGTGRSGINHFGDTRLNAWGPRLGFAYQARPTTVIRAGGGIFYQPVREDGNADNGNMGFAGRYWAPGNELTQGVNTIIDSTTTGGLLTPFYQNDMASQKPPTINPGILIGQGIFWYQPKAGRTPYFGTWDLTGEQGIGKNSLFRASYHGNAGIKLLYKKINPDQLDPKFLYQYGNDLLVKNVSDPAVQALGIVPSWIPGNYQLGQVLTPFPQYSSINVNAGGAADGHSRWHALELSLEHRYSDGFQTMFSYTFSRMVGNTDGEDANRGDGAAQNTYDLNSEKSIDRDDQTHVLSWNYVYELPFGKGRHFLGTSPRILDAAIGGWKFSGIERFNSGAPMQVGGGLDWMAGASSNSRASWAPGYGPHSQLKNPHYNKFDPTSNYLNTAAFEHAPHVVLPSGIRYGTYGTTPRFISQLRGHWGMQDDINLMKNFAVTENKSFEFRASAFNFLNNHYPSYPDTNVDDSNFGQVTNPQGNSPRSIQFALKFIF